MIILPMQHKLDWRQPPFLTIGLILANILAFILFQTGEGKVLKSISDEYRNSGLLYMEAPFYSQYLSRRLSEGRSIEPEWVAFVEESVSKKELESIQKEMIFDFDFVDFLDESKDTIWSPADANWWMETRTTFYQNELKQLSSFAYGYIPNEMSFSKLFTSQFMHGGVVHLLGNMLVLFILGFGLERMLNRAKLLLIYLLTGAIGAFSYGLIDLSSAVPLVGASGAISGLMGVYVGMLATQKIRFFYFVFAAFGYFTAPALIILPIWVVNELVQFWSYPDSPVAYFAHIGGLVSGGLIGWVFKSTWLKAKEDTLAIEDESAAIFRKQYAQALVDIEELRFNQARNKLWALWKKKPEELYLLEHLFHLYKMLPQSKQLHLVMNQWLKHESFPYSDSFWKCLEEYLNHESSAQMLSPSMRLKLVEAALDGEQMLILEGMVKLLDENKQRALLIRVVKKLKQHFKTTTFVMKSDEYDRWLEKLMNSEAG